MFRLSPPRSFTISFHLFCKFWMFLFDVDYFLPMSFGGRFPSGFFLLVDFNSHKHILSFLSWICVLPLILPALCLYDLLLDRSSTK